MLTGGLLPFPRTGCALCACAMLSHPWLHERIPRLSQGKPAAHGKKQGLDGPDDDRTAHDARGGGHRARRGPSVHRARRRLAAGELRRAQARRGAPGSRLRGALRGARLPRASSSGSPPARSASPPRPSPSRRRDQALAIEGGDARGLIYGALAAAEALRNGTRLEQIRGRPRGAPPRVPRRQVQHSLGHLPAQLGPRPALRHGARRPVLGGLSRHAGREPLQRDQPVDAAPVHLHDPAAELPRGQPVDARPSSRSGGSSTARSSAWPRSAGSTPTSCTGASS